MTFFCGNLNGVKCRKLMNHYINIINGINKIFIEMSKGVASDIEIYKASNKYKLY